MKRKEDFLRAFGPPDPGFEHSVRRALTTIRKEEQRVKKLKWVLVLAAIMVLIAAVALAATNSFGLADFIRRYQGLANSRLHENPDIIQKGDGVTGGETADARFTLKEAVYDGVQAYLVYEIAPNDANTFLLWEIDSPDDPMPAFEDVGGEHSGMKFREYAAEKGLRLLSASVFEPSFEGKDHYCDSADGVYLSDGKLMVMQTYSVTGSPDALAFDITCRLREGGSIEVIEETKLTFSLKKTGGDETRKGVLPVTFAQSGVRIDEVNLTPSPMGVYVEVIYTVVDEAAYKLMDDGLWFEFLDENGERMPGGGSGGGEVGDLGEGRYRQFGAIGAMAELPDSITMRAFNCWDKTRYDTVTIDIQ